MKKFIVLVVIGQLLAATLAAATPGVVTMDNAIDPNLRESRFDAYGLIDNNFDPFGPMDATFDPSKYPDLRPSNFDAFGPIKEKNPYFNQDEIIDYQNDVILPKYYKNIKLSRSGGEYFDSSSSFDIYNDLVYGSEFMADNALFFQGLAYPFGSMFPFAEDLSFELHSFHPMADFAESLEDIDSYFGDASRDLFDYFGGTFDSQGDAGEFGGNLASFFSQIYDGPVYQTEDIMAP